MWQYWNLGVRCAIAVVFVVSTASKLTSRSAFADFVASARNIGGLRRRQAGPVATVVIAVEAAAAVLTAVPATAAAGLCLSTGVLVGFAYAVARAVRQRRAGPCRCFGPSRTPLGRGQVVRNLALAVVAVSGVLAGQPGTVTPAGAALAICGGALAAAVVIRFDEIVELFVIR